MFFKLLFIVNTSSHTNNVLLINVHDKLPFEMNCQHRRGTEDEQLFRSVAVDRRRLLLLIVVVRIRIVVAKSRCQEGAAIARPTIGSGQQLGRRELR